MGERNRHTEPRGYSHNYIRLPVHRKLLVGICKEVTSGIIIIIIKMTLCAMWKLDISR